MTQFHSIPISKMMFVVVLLVSLSLVEFSSSSESNEGVVDLKHFTKDTNVTALWELYKTTYNKHYDSDEESAMRFDIFAANVKKIAEHNEDYENGKSTYKMGLNTFADYTIEEFRKFRTGGISG